MHAKLRRQKCWSRPVSSSTVEPDGRTSAPVNWFSELAIRGWIVTPVILMQLQLTTRLPLLSTYIGARSFWIIFIFSFFLSLFLSLPSLVLVILLSLFNSFFYFLVSSRKWKSWRESVLFFFTWDNSVQSVYCIECEKARFNAWKYVIRGYLCVICRKY